VAEAMHELSVSFRTPWFQRMWAWFMLGLAYMLVGLVIPASVWGSLGFALLWQSPPWWWHIVGLGMVAAGGTLVARVSRNSLVHQLSLLDEGFRLDGVRHGELTPYEDVSLLRLEQDEDRTIGVGRLNRVEIECRSGRKHVIWLSDADAHDCVAAMNDLCEHAGAVSSDGDMVLPEEINARIAAMQALTWGYWKRGIGCVALALFLCIPLGAFGYALFKSGGAPNLTVPKAARLGMCILGVGAGSVGAYRYFRSACAMGAELRHLRSDTTTLDT
jgi:hypothetical protein